MGEEKKAEFTITWLCGRQNVDDHFSQSIFIGKIHREAYRFSGAIWKPWRWSTGSSGTCARCAANRIPGYCADPGGPLCGQAALPGGTGHDCFRVPPFPGEKESCGHLPLCLVRLPCILEPHIAAARGHPLVVEAAAWHRGLSQGPLQVLLGSHPRAREQITPECVSDGTQL